ncbi:hypothetical protein ACTXT7_008630 [Hymenolepis weldensis]
MEMSWSRARENSIVNAVLTHSEHSSLSEECVALWTKILDPTEVPTVMHAHEVSSNSDVFGVSSEVHIMTPQLFPQSLRVNVDADACVETLQTIVVKPPWTDSVANGRRPSYVHQRDSAPSHKALKTQN